MTSDVRQVERGTLRGFVRDIPAGSVHLAGRDDATPLHHQYPRGYDSRCSWCWLGYKHSEAAHAAYTDTEGQVI